MMQSFFTASWQILAVGLVLGAGLPALFALGVRAMAYGAGGDTEVDPAPGHPIGKVVGIAVFAVVIAAIAVGIAVIVASGFGYQASFDHGYPTFAPKH